MGEVTLQEEPDSRVHVALEGRPGLAPGDDSVPASPWVMGREPEADEAAASRVDDLRSVADVPDQDRPSEAVVERRP